jgi:hypothetical protein
MAVALWIFLPRGPRPAPGGAAASLAIVAGGAALLVSAAMMAAALFARSFRRGQSYLGTILRVLWCRGSPPRSSICPSPERLVVPALNLALAVRRARRKARPRPGTVAFSSAVWGGAIAAPPG